MKLALETLPPAAAGCYDGLARIVHTADLERDDLVPTFMNSY